MGKVHEVPEEGGEGPGTAQAKASSKVPGGSHDLSLLLLEGILPEN